MKKNYYIDWLIDWLIDWVENSMILVFVGFRQHYNHWPGRWEPCNRRLLNYRIWGNFFLKLYPPFLIDFYRHSLLKLAWGEKKNWNPAPSRPFPSSPEPLYQNEVKCSAFDMKMTFHSCANKNYFHKKRLCTWPHFKSEGFLNSEVAHWYGRDGV